MCNHSFTYQIYRSENCPVTEDFLKNLPQYFSTHGTLIHNERNQIKVLEVNGIKINVKKYCIPPIINRIFYSTGLRTPKAKSTYQNALQILKKGFSTPAPFAYILERKKGLLYHSYFISQQVEAKPVGHSCTDKNLIAALAEHTAKMHQSGLMHKDFTPGNILYSQKDGKYSFIFVDINRFRCSEKPIGRAGTHKNLMQPFHKEDLIKFFVYEYAKHRAIPPHNTWHFVIYLRRLRNLYDETKKYLKKIPGAKWFINKPINTKHK